MLAFGLTGPFTDKFMKTFEKSQQVPTQKYPYPQTSSQEYGWESAPLVRVLPFLVKLAGSDSLFWNILYFYFSFALSSCCLVHFGCKA